MSEKEEVSVKSTSNYAEINENVKALPLTAKCYAENIKYYRFKIERLYQDTRTILKELIDNKNIDQNMIEEIGDDIHKPSPSLDSQSFNKFTEREVLSRDSYVYTFSDIGKSIDFKSKEAVEKCLKDVEDNSSINSMLPELSFDQSHNAVFFDHFGHLLHKADFGEAVKQSNLAEHFPSEFYSYALLKDVNLGAMRSILIYMILSQLLEGTLGGLPQKDAVFKTSGSISNGSVSHFLNKLFCSILVAFSDTPTSGFKFETNSLQSCLHIVMLSTPLELIDLKGLEQNTQKFGRSSTHVGGSRDVRVVKPAVFSSRQTKYSHASISKLLVTMDADGDNKLGQEDILRFAKKNEVFIGPEVLYDHSDSSGNDSRSKQEEICIYEGKGGTEKT